MNDEGLEVRASDPSHLLLRNLKSRVLPACQEDDLVLGSALERFRAERRVSRPLHYNMAARLGAEERRWTAKSAAPRFTGYIEDVTPLLAGRKQVGPYLG